MLDFTTFNKNKIFGHCLCKAYAFVEAENKIKVEGVFKDFFKNLKIKRVKSTENFLGKCSLNNGKVHVEINSSAFRDMCISEKLTEKELTMKIIETLRHELRHVLQLLYAWNYLKNLTKISKMFDKINKTFNYFNNPLEVDARRHENVPIMSTDCGLLMSKLTKLYA